jgi:hypothetical protein
MLNLILAAFDNLKFFDNWDVVLTALDFLWKGLLAIFVVIGLIVLAVKFTSFCINKAEEAKKRREDTADKSVNDGK